MSDKNITVFLADDHTIVRQGLAKLLEGEPDLRVIGEAENGREAVVKVEKLKPDIVLMDIAMPMLNGIEATRQIRKSALKPRSSFFPCTPTSATSVNFSVSALQDTCSNLRPERILSTPFTPP
jgi:DNA-binding NarL/FixJ family response regulator